eukprot:TRINITY_DN47525_c0_g1_i1.p1 TRINITY_DN47525_c0_g1~~TRINITY_DN47525_c0_g1_i1.p1  ORF type:complete len:454 (-),score=73.60 TRINITY_DN47525_c0_g1_i1:192-1553(-)
MKGLRSKLLRLTTEHCGAGSQRPNVLTFERWLARFALRRDPLKVEEPLIPSDGALDEGLVADLARVMSAEADTAIASAVTSEGQRAAARIAGRGVGGASAAMTSEECQSKIRDAVKLIRSLALKARRGSQDALRDLSAEAGRLKAIASAGLAVANDGAAQVGCSTGSAQVWVDTKRQKGTVDVSLEGTKPYLSISAAHYAKLRRLYGRHSGSEASDVEHKFHEVLYCCLARYEALKGAGYQCAVPGSAFDSVRPKLGHMIECFASPLNCHYDRFCSAFGPLEACFGSLGSFFDLDPEEGSFEANPPFVPEIMDAMLVRIENLLGDSSRGALSFLVVIPAWGAGVRCCRDLERSKHCRACTKIAASSHGFCDGAQHLDSIRDLYRPSSWDTSVALLQNKKGAARWPLSQADLEECFVGSMCEVVRGGPSLQQWENRGKWYGGSAKSKWTPDANR